MVSEEVRVFRFDGEIEEFSLGACESELSEDAQIEDVWLESPMPFDTQETVPSDEKQAERNQQIKPEPRGPGSFLVKGVCA